MQTKLRVLLVGAGGVIGRCVHAELSKDCEVLTAGLDNAQFVFDLADTQALLVSLKKVGPLDAVISTAGRANFGSLNTIEAQEIDASPYGLGLKDKLMGQVNLALAARSVLKPGGSITLTSGTTSQEPILGGSGLSMVNGALESWVMAAATELPAGLRINVVSPSLVEGTPARAVAAFPGFALVSEQTVAQAYRRCLQSGLNGRVLRV